MIGHYSRSQNFYNHFFIHYQTKKLLLLVKSLIEFWKWLASLPGHVVEWCKQENGQDVKPGLNVVSQPEKRGAHRYVPVGRQKYWLKREAINARNFSEFVSMHLIYWLGGWLSQPKQCGLTNTFDFSFNYGPYVRSLRAL